MRQTSESNQSENFMGVQQRLMVFFNRSAGMLLLLTGLAKVISSNGSAEILSENDPVLGVPFRDLLFIVGMAELLLVGFLLFGQRLKLQAVLVAWLASNFLVYRLAYLSTGFNHCPCLGTITKQLHISEGLADTIMMCILAYLIAGSVTYLFWLRFYNVPQRT